MCLNLVGPHTEVVGIWSPDFKEEGFLYESSSSIVSGHFVLQTKAQSSRFTSFATAIKTAVTLVCCWPLCSPLSIPLCVPAFTYSQDSSFMCLTKMLNIAKIFWPEFYFSKGECLKIYSQSYYWKQNCLTFIGSK